ncbi:universal stress protein [Neptunicoccus cionae]|uniref:universal stress protein n=1 Tax=Neptunicoccus cionae TaxID=2035344 RepID=UPI0011AE978A|nr:universal stress protein [Amylibacter cionae]
MINNVLVAFNGGRASRAAVRAAVNMSKKYDAHLTGLLAYSRAEIERNLPGWFPDTMRASIAEITEAKTLEIHESFMSLATQSLPQAKVHWIDDQGDADRLVIQHSRLFDVLVLGQYEQLPQASEFMLHPDKIAERSGRPLLLTPTHYAQDYINDCAVLAWDGGDSAAKAAMSSIPYLKTKKSVHVVTVRASKPQKTQADEALRNQLLRHGIDASFVTLDPVRHSISKAIVQFCQEVDAGLLVSGAYGHKRVAEDLFGGVTKDLMTHTNIPVLMAH